jgi:hypothetical protein
VENKIPWRKEKQGDRECWTVNFDSMSAYWAAAVDGKNTSGDAEKDRQSRSGGANWTGSPSFEAAERLARFGWQEGTASIGKLAARITDRIGDRAKVEHMVRDVVGEFPDVAAYLDGEPENMIRFEDEDKQACGRIVRLSVNAAVSSGVGAEVIARRGAVVVALADAIERTGHLAEITFRMDASCYSKDMAIQATVKKTDEPMNVARIAFALAHPSMFRRMTFAVMETCPDAKSMHCDSGGSYGSPSETPEKLRGEIHFGNMRYGQDQWSTDEKAEAWALAELRKLGLLEESDVKAYASK